MFRSRTKEAPAVEDTAADVYPTEDTGFGSHALHAADAKCARCNRDLKETDEARRKADGTYVHLCC
jgi:hypothetical protein